MIARGIISEMIDEFHARVRIPKYNKGEGAIGATPDSELYIATISCDAGVRPALRNGDVVILGFENSDNTNPMIIGVLFNEKSKSTKSEIDCLRLDVSSSASLPEETSIGDIDPSTIKYLSGLTSNIQSQLDELYKVFDTYNLYEEDLREAVTKSRQNSAQIAALITALKEYHPDLGN